MISAKKHFKEEERLKDLASYSILDTLPESDYDNLTAIASEICNAPISLISLIDNDRQWFKSHHGLEASETPKELAFCAHAINDQDNILIVPDARKDDRFHDNPLVTGNPNVIFYAGVPLISESGLPLGTLCVIDKKPHELSDNQLHSLKALSTQVMNLLELRKKKKLLEESLLKLEERNQQLERSWQKVSDYKTAIDASTIVAITDSKGDIMYVNDEFIKISKYSEDELLGKNQRIVNSSYHPKSFWTEMWGTIGKGNIWQNEIRNKAKDGTYYWVDTTIVPFLDKNNKPYQYLAIRKDITQQKNMKERIIKSIIFSQEKDREYFAEDLHEGLAQTLFGLTLQLQVIESKIKDRFDRELKDSISSIKEYVNQSIENTRNLAVELMPRSMMEYGLIPSIDNYIHKLNTTDFNIDFYADLKNEKIEKNVEITIYRALVAIIEKAKSSNAIQKIIVEINDEDGIQTKIEIQGKLEFISKKGIDKKAIDLIATQKRIELHGGQLIIDQDAAKEKTVICIKFDLQ